MQKFNRIKKTLAALLLGTGQEFIFQVLSVILWIRFWGAEAYSEWLLISLLPMLILRGNTGIFHSATSKLIYQFTHKNYEAAGVTYSALFIGQLLFLIVVALVYGVVALSLGALSQPKSFTDIDIIIIILLFFIQFSIFQWQQSILSLVKADGKAPAAVMWQNHFRLGGIFFLLAGAVFTGPINCLILAICSQFVVVLMTLRCSRESISKVKFDFSSIPRSEVVFLIRKGLQFSLFPFGQSAVHTCTVWMLGYFFGALVGAAYHNMRTVSRSVVLLSRAGEQAVRFELSELFAKQKYLDARELLKQSLIYSLVFCGAVALVLLFIGQSVFEYLTNSELVFEYVPYFLLSLGAFIFSVTQIYLAVPFSLNKQGAMSKIYIIIVILTLVICFPIASTGMIGVTGVILVSELLLLYYARASSVRLVAS